ncbi:response regulator transcription factor [Marinobacterium sp. AK62]|uniref:Response regulator transcription factor n=1 Tax=Marinobacterium alkalitolerans TaxID=1542925 RepID=A0ABS3Z8X5_9GAMM|nr:response regulator transcription factor [Marinobacterium alkalitolerans]MBP0047728.1 response regulator transcription factor [Marinobacterium alkalitolerans]
MTVLMNVKRHDLEQRWKEALARAGEPAQRLEPGVNIRSDDVVLVHWSALEGEARTACLADAAAHRVVALVDEPRLEEGEELLRQGVYGYANTFMQPELLPEVVKTVDRGDLWILPELMQRLLKRLLHRPSNLQLETADWGLSQRELEVLTELAQGKGNKVIARELAITERTVKAHVSSILEKAGVQDRVELILRLSGTQPLNMIEQEQGYEH